MDTSPTGSPAIDTPTFAELCETVGDEFAAELVAAFLDDTPAILASLRTALATADADGFRRAAHSLKSNGQTFGALRLADLARRAELDGITGDGAADGAALDAIDHAYTEAAAVLGAWSRG